MDRIVQLGATEYFIFNTSQFSTGAPFTLAGTPSVSIYEDNGATQITAGITLTVDLDSKTGMHGVAVVASGANGFEAGKRYIGVIEAGTVDSISAVGKKVFEFRIETAPELAQNQFRDYVMPTATLTTQTGVSDNTAVNLTGIVDAQSQDDAFNGHLGILRDGTDGQLYIVRITDFTNTNLLASIEALDPGVTLPTPASGDLFWFVGIDPAYGAGVNLTEAGGDGDHLTEAGGDGDHLTEAGGDGDHLTEAGGTGDQFSALAVANLDAAALQQIVDDLENGGRLDLLIDAIKAKTDQLTFGVTNTVNANATHINEVALGGDGTSGDPWGPA